MSYFLSIDSVFFTVMGYPMSYIEFVRTVLYLWSVWLISERRMLTWPVGIVSVVLYMVLFYQIRLYSDALEQLYYLGASVYGWWYWSSTRETEDTGICFGFSGLRMICFLIICTLVLSALLGYAMSSIHLWFPRLFPEPASYPFLDALTTVMSFTAMWLLARKHTESWIYWIIVDVIGIWLYFIKDVKFISLLYVILLCISTRGLLTWIRFDGKIRQKVEDKKCFAE